MKLHIDRTPLLRALGRVQSVVEHKATIPILRNVKLVASDGRLAVTATDLDLEVVETVAADVAETGGTTVAGKLLFGLVRGAADGCTIELETVGSDLVIRLGKSLSALPTLPAQDFPAIKIGEAAHRFELSAPVLLEMIQSTGFAVSNDEWRSYLCGLYLHVADGVLRAAANDGLIVARTETALPEGVAGMPGIIVPRKTLAQLVRLLEDAEGVVSVELSDFLIRFGLGDVVFISKLIDGIYPDYGRVIPSENTKILEIDRKPFLAILTRMDAISDEKYHAVKLTCERNQVTLSVNNQGVGSSVETIECAYSAEPVEVGLNIKHLQKIVNAISSDVLKIAIRDSATPVIITGLDDTETLYVNMVVRV